MKRLILCVLALSLLIPAWAQEGNKKNEHNFEIAKNLDIFNALYRELDLFYVDTLEAQKVIRMGIDAMLEELDPYTVYYPEEDMSELKIMTTGKYGGIGSIIRMRKDSTVIIAEPYENMPAAELGLQVGDVLLQIDDTDLKGKAVGEVSDMLRGEPGTTFSLKVQRPGESKPRTFNITRRNIKLPSIQYQGLIADKIGYILLTGFTENCSQDVRKAVISLKEEGAESLVLDLRGNGGGLLQEAINIVNLFVPKGLEIVSTKGKMQAANAVYKTKSSPLDLDIPLVVMVNGNTASAAEIVAGSLQDLDRAVVLGTRTFGKGLVQVPRELPYNGSLKLTSSKYYIPSGRCIQAIDYKSRREGRIGADGRVPDSLTHVFHTAGGREVRDGGGVKPDVEMKHDTLANLLYYLSNDDVLVDYGTRYVQTHPKPASVAQFTMTDQDFEDLKQMAIESDFKYDRLSERRLKDLKATAEFEGYYNEAKEEFDALEKKLQHNLGLEFNHFKKDVMVLMRQEVVKRWFFQRGISEEQLKDDEDANAAINLLHEPSRYRSILTPGQQ